MTARALQKLIHVGCRELGIDRDDRHSLQVITTGKESLSDMSESDLLKMVDALKARGFKPDNRGKRPRAGRADVRYCHVLWRLLHEKGIVRVAGADGLNAFIRSRFSEKWGAEPIDIDVMRDWSQINDVVSALQDWCRRQGIPFRKEA